MIPPDKKNDSSDCKTLAEGQPPAKPCLDGFVKCLHHKENIETLALSSFGLDKVQLPLLLQNEGQALVYILVYRHLCPSQRPPRPPIHHHQIPEGVPQRSWMLVTSVLICPAFFSQAPDFQETKRRAFSTECPCIHLLSTRAANATFETQWNFFLRDSATKSSGNPQFQSAAHHQIYPLGTLAGLHWMIEREDCADSRLRMPAADG